jgi:predicted  nucleic acid-binding Zn-ribbon protein
MNTEDRLQLMALRNDVAELEKRRSKIADETKELAQQHSELTNVILDGLQQHSELTNIIDQLKVRISELEKR